MSELNKNYLDDIKRLFQYYRKLGQQTIDQVPDDKLGFIPNSVSNSISVIVKHLSGNMRSRWTDFLTSDGEKPTRDRDDEFVDSISDRKSLQQVWDQGWDVLEDALNGLGPSDLEKIIYIRNQGHTALEAINRQLVHYSYHVGQMVFLGKMICGEDWSTLSVARGDSRKFNKEHFEKEKERKHFTE